LPDSRNGDDSQGGPGHREWLPYALVAGLMTALLYLLLQQPAGSRGFEVSYSQLKTWLAQGRVEQVVLRGNEVAGVLRTEAPIGPQGQLGKYFRTRVPSLGDSSLLSSLESHGVQVQVAEPEGSGWSGSVLVLLLPWLILMFFFYWAFQRTYRQVGGGLGGPSELKRFLESPAREATVPGVTFADVAGQEGAKGEVAELVHYLQNPNQFRKLGAEVPRGVLLMGPPGTGKTLLARALAGEAGVKFYSISASEFIEVFVGVGASRVRHLFEAARKNAPSIVFIDELDSIGRTRGTGLGGGHDEREQTLNQILAELDGFTGREAVIVLAATNRPDVLDPALLRPGRFDRHVTLDLPDRKDREAIVGVHTRRVPLAPDVNLGGIASGTAGFSGADLKNLVNEAALLAARDRANAVGRRHFDEARDKLLLGTVRGLVIQPDERHRLAVHEGGHALVAYFLPHADPVHKVTIIPRGHTLGGTQQMPEQERHTLPLDYLRDRLAVILGGRVSEQEILGTVSSGADDDIRQATTLARAMVSRWGMSQAVGPVDLRESEEQPFLGREIALPRRFSEHSAEAVDEAVRDLLLEAEERARQLVRGRRSVLERLVTLLEARETLQREDIEACLGPRLLAQTFGSASA
jgi:cell division protease FtsH